MLVTLNLANVISARRRRWRGAGGADGGDRDGQPRVELIGAAGAKSLAEAVKADVRSRRSTSTAAPSATRARARSRGAGGQPRLHELNLQSNAIGDAGAKALAIGLAANRGLATLNLEHNVVGDAGAEALADAKLVGSTAAVDLEHNRMTQAGREALEKAGEEGGLLADAKPKHEL